MVKKARSPYVGELRDPKTYISTEDHRQMTNRLIAAGIQGIHGRPGDRKPKGK